MSNKDVINAANSVDKNGTSALSPEEIKQLMSAVKGMSAVAEEISASVRRCTDIVDGSNRILDRTIDNGGVGHAVDSRPHQPVVSMPGQIIRHKGKSYMIAPYGGRLEKLGQ